MHALMLSIMILSAAPSDAGLSGCFGNVTASPFTGDIWGTELTLKFDGKTWSGSWRRAGYSPAEMPIASAAYDEAAKTLRFKLTDEYKKDHRSAVRAVRGGILFKLDEAADERWEFLRTGNVSGRDYAAAYITQDGTHFKKGASDDINPSDIIAPLRTGERVTLLLKEEDAIQNGYVRCEWNGKKGFVDEMYLWPEERQVVTGSNVRLRSKPGTDGAILETLAEGTAVTVILPPEGEWIRVSVGAKKGFISFRYVSK